MTYGAASAPYLATRCLRQLGLECSNERVSEVILHDFFIDDLLTGGDDLSEVQDLRQKVSAVLASAQMVLRKWKSNESTLMSEPHLSKSSLDLNVGTTESSKTLGLGWHPQSDLLYFPICLSDHTCYTKRDMLSLISQIFDPLGLLAPVVIVLKMLLQKLWLDKLSWYEQLSPEIKMLWVDVIRDHPLLNKIKIPRHVLCKSHKFIEFHVMTDASENPYGACLYARSVDQSDEVTVRLLMAKSRVAPLKPTTIPRLELCAALVGTRLYEKVMSSLRVQATRTYFWTDSTIVLCWLKMMPNKLQTFVRNRIAEIQDKTASCEWRHVPTAQNPADHLSRGITATVLSDLDQWWSGPAFLKESPSSWPGNMYQHAQKDALPEINLLCHCTLILIKYRLKMLSILTDSQVS